MNQVITKECEHICDGNWDDSVWQSVYCEELTKDDKTFTDKSENLQLFGMSQPLPISSSSKIGPENHYKATDFVVVDFQCIIRLVGLAVKSSIYCISCLCLQHLKPQCTYLKEKPLSPL